MGDIGMTTIVVAVVVAVVALIIGSLLGWNRRKSVAERKSPVRRKKRLALSTKPSKALKIRSAKRWWKPRRTFSSSAANMSKEVKERRADLQKQERRLQQKEENLDRKTDAIEKKEELLTQKHAQLDEEKEEIQSIKRSQTELLERISGLTADEAKAYLISQVEAEVTHEAAMKIKEIETRAKDEADAKAKEIIATAIQRCAADQVSEITVSPWYPLPNDEMKGRIIGREGRNIRYA